MSNLLGGSMLGAFLGLEWWNWLIVVILVVLIVVLLQIRKRQV